MCEKVAPLFALLVFIGIYFSHLLGGAGVRPRSRQDMVGTTAVIANFCGVELVEEKSSAG